MCFFDVKFKEKSIPEASYRKCYSFAKVIVDHVKVTYASYFEEIKAVFDQRYVMFYKLGEFFEGSVAVTYKT